MNVRVGDAERGHVIELLGTALAEGYLELSEYEQRMAVVAAARTAGELAQPMADLPQRLRWQPQQQMMPVPPPFPVAAPVDRRAHATAVISLVLSIMSVPFAVCYGFGAVFGIAAMVLSRPGLRSSTDYGKALTGLVVGAVGTLLSLGMLAVFLLRG